jgi:hypothetical protein
MIALGGRAAKGLMAFSISCVKAGLTNSSAPVRAFVSYKYRKKRTWIDNSDAGQAEHCQEISPNGFKLGRIDFFATRTHKRLGEIRTALVQLAFILAEVARLNVQSLKIKGYMGKTTNFIKVSNMCDRTINKKEEEKTWGKTNLDDFLLGVASTHSSCLLHLALLALLNQDLM